MKTIICLILTLITLTSIQSNALYNFHSLAIVEKNNEITFSIEGASLKILDQQINLPGEIFYNDQKEYLIGRVGEYFRFVLRANKPLKSLACKFPYTQVEVLYGVNNSPLINKAIGICKPGNYINEYFCFAETPVIQEEGMLYAHIQVVDELGNKCPIRSPNTPIAFEVTPANCSLLKFDIPHNNQPWPIPQIAVDQTQRSLTLKQFKSLCVQYDYDRMNILGLKEYTSPWSTELHGRIEFYSKNASPLAPLLIYEFYPGSPISDWFHAISIPRNADIAKVYFFGIDRETKEVFYDDNFKNKFTLDLDKTAYEQNDFTGIRE